MSHEGSQPYVVDSSLPCDPAGDHLDHKGTTCLDRLLYVVEIFRRSPHQTGEAREVDEDSVLHDQIEPQILYLST